MDNLEEYDEKTLKHVQKIQLMIFKDFIQICENNDIKYMAYGGTLLGAIRHNGFIPWDDDTDVIMMREEYEKFIKVMESKHFDKYSIYTLKNTEDYFRFFTKFSLNETEFREDWTRNTKFNLGFSLDIFVFDDVPSNNLKFRIYYTKMFIIRGILNMFIINLNKNYPSLIKKILTIFGVKFMKICGITPNRVKNYYKKIINSNHNKHQHVYENIAQTYAEPIPKEAIYPLKKCKFEDIEVNVPNDYDLLLTIGYGDYMELPPLEDRKVHPHDYIDFGPY